MNVTEAMQEIEGARFAALVNLASDFRTFARILASQPAVGRLLGAMQDEAVARAVLARAMHLAGTGPADTYEHPADAALAAYVWLLGARGQDYSEMAASAVLACASCWWARKMAEHVRNARRFHSGAMLVRLALPAERPRVDYTAHAGEAVFSVLAALRQSSPLGAAGSPRQASELLLYAVGPGDWRTLFRNHDTGTRAPELLAGK